MKKAGLSLILSALCSVSLFSQDFTDYQWDKNLEGRTIRNINIIVLNVSESFDERENLADSAWFKNLTNSLHYKTRDWVIRERLLIRKGDELNFRDLYESERLLRSTNLFVEVRINLLPVYSSPYEVDVEVITKDRWTLALLAKYNPGSKSGYLGLKDNNFIGLGHTSEIAVTYNDDPDIGLGGRFRYTASNIKGSYIDAGLKLEANKKTTLRSINISRPFITYKTEWIGGVELKGERNRLDITDSTNTVITSALERSSQDLWLGKAFQVHIDKGLFAHNTNLITSVRVLSLNHSERPVSPSVLRIFENSTLLLFGAGLISRNFYRDKFVRDFGIIEDIPYGTMVSFATGPEKRELSNRWYFGLEAIYSNWFDEYGYLSGRVGLGTFKGKNNWEQNTFNFNLLYHTYLYRWKIWTYRLFFNYDLLVGYNRLSGEKIYLYSSTGLRGINKILLDGTKRMVINSEARIFSPFRFLGFVLGGIALIDLGFIEDKDRNIFSGRFYQAYGAGFRVKNESIINAALELVFVFNPYNPQNNGAAFSVLFSTNFALNIRDIGYSKPFIEQY